MVHGLYAASQLHAEEPKGPHDAQGTERGMDEPL